MKSPMLACASENPLRLRRFFVREGFAFPKLQCRRLRLRRQGAALQAAWAGKAEPFRTKERQSRQGHRLAGSVCAVVTVLIAATFLAAQEPVPQQGGRRNPGQMRDFLGLGTPIDPAAAARGEKLYTPNCAFCHGAKATGAAGPNLVRSDPVLHDEKGETLGPIVRKGRPESGMPAFPNMTQDQIIDLSQFLHQRVEAIANRGSYQRLNVVTGDMEKGRAYFNGVGRCNTCHSVTGDLAHVATKFRQPDQLQNRFLYPTGAQRRATITLPSGTQFTGTIKRMDDFNISIVDEGGNLRSFARDSIKLEITDPLSAHRELLAKYTDADMHNITAYLVTLK